MSRRAGVLLAALLCIGAACDRDELETERPRVDRIVTLAPHLAELMFAVGAGNKVVGVSAWSDYPPEVSALPVVGDAFTLDHEQLTLLQPDLLLAWESGMPAHVIDELRRAGYRVQVVRTQSVDDVQRAMLELGELTGRQESARIAVAEFRSGLDELAARGADAEPLRVFYQLSDRPLFTISGRHFLSDLISLCGGQNIFADLDELAPAISDEAVIARDPEVMIAADASEADPFAEWQRWPGIAANHYGNHFRIDADVSSRPTPRLITAGRQIREAD